MNLSEQRFDAYLRENGYVSEFEPDWRVRLDLPRAPTTCPDFLVSRGASRAVCEVRGFETEGIRKHLAGWIGVATLSERQRFGPLRWALAEKAKQLIPFAGSGLPLVIVLSNPLGAGVMLDDVSVCAAMRIALSPPGAPNSHPHVSGVVVVHERRHADDWIDGALATATPPATRTIAGAVDRIFDALPLIAARRAAGEEPPGSYRWLDVYEVRGSTTPLPTDWFDGERDRRYGVSPDGSYARLS